jgi:glycosyltransferase involved in cell wall biosynthesis
MNRPIVTVLMPVYNGEKYLREAIESILRQTFRNFELLIIDDGSTDRSVEIIEAYDDPRIRLVHNGANLKLISTLNRGLSLARGAYVARMDCDDISLPERLSKQVAYMNEHPEVGICGTWSKTIGEVEKSWETCFPIRHSEIVAHLLFNTAISHPTAMFNVKKLRSANLKYDVNALDAEDYDLWVNASDYFKLGNVPEVLFFYRVHLRQISQTAARQQQMTTAAVRMKMLTKIGVTVTDDDLSLHCRLSDYSWENSHFFYSDINHWFNKMGRMVKPTYKKAVKKECLKRLLELHKFVFGPHRTIERAFLSIREML